MEGDPNADIRVLRLTRDEEKKLIARIENIANYDELRAIEARMQTLLGIELTITPSIHEVKTARGLAIALVERPGLCKKLRQSIPAAVRRCLDKQPEIVYAILDTHDLLGSLHLPAPAPTHGSEQEQR